MNGLLLHYRCSAWGYPIHTECDPSWGLKFPSTQVFLHLYTCTIHTTQYYRCVHMKYWNSRVVLLSNRVIHLYIKSTAKIRRLDNWLYTVFHVFLMGNLHPAFGLKFREKIYYPVLLYIAHLEVLVWYKTFMNLIWINCWQVQEIFTTGGDLHLELPSGEKEASREMWVSATTRPTTLAGPTTFFSSFNGGDELSHRQSSRNETKKTKQNLDFEFYSIIYSC